MRNPLSAVLAVGLVWPCLSAPPVALEDGYYVLNGRKVLVNALGYEPGARPGEAPYLKRVSHLSQIRRDLQLIKRAGFNAIRTWSELTEPELKLVQASGLKVIYGIWLPPDEDFGKPEVLARDLAKVRSALAFTRKYDCVITYLVMNEPMPEHLMKVGAQATRKLWTTVVELIHSLHPGVPVTISGNSAITEWVDMNLFDVYARNAYDYGDGAHFTHGFARAQAEIHASQGGTKPSLLTEFGRSVSRKGSGGYGGNTLQEQADAMVKYYRDILDSGATGLCPFYYADGWWKSGNPAVHDDEPEEWFGLFGFADINDAKGHPRPAWYAMERYNLALVTLPRNQEFYRNEVPFEVFCQPEVKRVRVIHQSRVLREVQPDIQGHCFGTLSFVGEPLRDRELTIESLDAKGRVIKDETLIVLTGPDPIRWPDLSLSTPLPDLAGAKEIPLTLQVGPPGIFTFGPEIRMAVSCHKGWDRAASLSVPLDAKGGALSRSFPLPEGSPMTALYAGVDIHFGKFRRTLGVHRYVYAGDWADALRIPSR